MLKRILGGSWKEKGMEDLLRMKHRLKRTEHSDGKANIMSMY